MDSDVIFPEVITVDLREKSFWFGGIFYASVLNNRSAICEKLSAQMILNPTAE